MSFVLRVPGKFKKLTENVYSRKLLSTLNCPWCAMRYVRLLDLCICVCVCASSICLQSMFLMCLSVQAERNPFIFIVVDFFTTNRTKNRFASSFVQFILFFSFSIAPHESKNAGNVSSVCERLLGVHMLPKYSGKVWMFKMNFKFHERCCALFLHSIIFYRVNFYRNWGL